MPRGNFGAIRATQKIHKNRNNSKSLDVRLAEVGLRLGNCRTRNTTIKLYIYTTVLPLSCNDGRYFYYISGTALLYIEIYIYISIRNCKIYYV